MSQPQLSKQRFAVRSPLDDDQRFLHRLLTAVGVVITAVLAVLLIWYGAEVLLLVFAGLLFAVFLYSLSMFVQEYTSLKNGGALLVVLGLLASGTILGSWLLAPSIVQQVNELTQRLPQAVARARQQVAEYPLAQQILSQVPALQQLFPQSGGVFARMTGMVSTVLGVMVNIVIILFIGIYLAVNPGLYRRGVVRLVPQRKRARAQEVLDTLAYTLRWWLIGRFTVMTLNGAFTAIGLWLLGIPLPLVLGLITGLLNFVPNVGPFLAAIPAVLLAFTLGSAKALYVALLFLVVQNLEGFVLTPLVQQRTVSLPPVLIITAQILLGIFFGFLGVLLAVPLAAVAFVLVRMLYVEDILGDPVDMAGSR